MADYPVAKAGVAYVFYVSLPSQANVLVFQANPTLAPGDVTVSTDGAAAANITTLPTVTPAGGKRVKVSLSAAEMTGDNVSVVFSDVAGAEWCDQQFDIQTSAVGIAELVRSTTPANTLTVDSSNRAQADLRSILATALTETVAGYLAAAFKKFLDVVTPVFTAASVNQGGDNFARLGAPAGASIAADIAEVEGETDAIAGIAADYARRTGDYSTYAGGDTAGTTTLLTRLSAARAGYLDNLNVGGAVASHADVVAVNQSASKHLLLVTVGQFEPGETYTVEMRTFAAADGSAVNADSTPTLTATGNVSGSLNANLSAATNPATGVYRWTYTPGATPTLEQIRLDGSAAIASATFTLSAYSQTVDFATVVFTATDQSHITSIFNKLPANNIADETLVLAAVGTPMQAGTQVTVATNNDKAGYALTVAYDAAKTASSQSSVNAIATILSGITSLANWIRAGFRSSVPDATALAEINTGGGTYDAGDSQEGILDRGNAAWITGSGGSGAGTGAYTHNINVKDGLGVNVPNANVRLTQGSDVMGPVSTDNSGNLTFHPNNLGSYAYIITRDGYQPATGTVIVASPTAATSNLVLTQNAAIPPAADPSQRTVRVDLGQFSTVQTDTLAGQVITQELQVLKASAATTGIAPVPRMGTQFVEIGVAEQFTDASGIADFPSTPTSSMTVDAGWVLKYQFKWGERVLATVALPAGDLSSVSLTALS